MHLKKSSLKIFLIKILLKYQNFKVDSLTLWFSYIAQENEGKERKYIFPVIILLSTIICIHGMNKNTFIYL